MKTMLVVTLFLLSPALVHGFCSQPTPKVCSLLFERESVFIGTVISGQVVPDKDDPGFIEGWLYQLRVDRSFRGMSRPTTQVHTPNDSSRLILDVAHQYVLFARSENGQLQIGNDCGPFSDSFHVMEPAREIENLRRARAAIVEGEVRKDRASGAGVPGVAITVAGMGRTYRLTSDRQGMFRRMVPPGRYRIDVDSRVAVLSDLSWIDPKNVELVKGQCAQLQFITR